MGLFQPTLKGLPLHLQEVQSALDTTRLGGKFHYFNELDSTNSHARRLAEEGAPEGVVVIAEQQSHGRGRLGRHWVSPPYANLYLTVILRPRLPPAEASQITLMAAIALADAVVSVVAERPAIKWPNDILVNGKKLAGVLTESSCHSDRIDYVILGIGVNVNFPRAFMPDELRERATSLMEAGGKWVSREAFLRRLIQGLDRCYEILEESGFGALAPRWEDYFGQRGKKVRAEMVDEVVLGRAMGIDHDGALLVKDERGELKRIIAGDVIALEN